jgi:hypothetical protein
MAVQQPLDALVIGGGHNGLVCAAYLAGAGRRVTVLEARGIVGGAAVTEEFHPGFRNSSCSYTVSLLNPRVISDLRLEAHGLRVVERPFANFLPLADGDAFRFGGEWTAREVARFSARDAARLDDWFAMLERVVVVLRALATETPPNVSDRFVLADWLASLVGGAQAQGAGHARPARPAGAVHEERRGAAGQLVRVGAAEGGPRVGLDRRQFRQPVCAGLGLRAAAPRVRRGERQVGGLGARDRGHGRDQRCDRGGGAGARRGDPDRRGRGAGAGARRAGGGRGAGRRDGDSRRGRSSRR